MEETLSDSRITRHASRITFSHLLRRVLSLVAQPPWLIFVLSLVMTTLPLPWVIDIWVPQGDEPHYLLAAHSLVVDGDLDLANNYAQNDQRPFYPNAIDRHVRIGVDGRSYLLHDIGLPIVIAPAYALGGRVGVTLFLAIVAALVAVNVYGLAFEMTAHHKAAAITWLAFSLTPLLSVYAYLVYPEMIGALAVIWSVRQLLAHAPVEPRNMQYATRISYSVSHIPLGVPIAISLLPWLSARFIPIAAFLALWSAWRWRDDRRRRAIAIGLPLLSLIAYFVASAWMNGGGSGAIDFNSGPISHGFQDFTLDRILRGLTGWWLDQQRGILIYSPVYIVALIGLPLLWRRLRWTGLALLMPFAIAYGLIVAWGGFWISWEVSARYLVVAIPLLAAPMALAWTHLRSWVFRGMATALLAISLLNTVLVLSVPGIAAYRESLVWIYDGGTPIDLWRSLPALGGGGRVDPDPDAISAATVVADGDRSAWHTPVGPGGAVIQSSSLNDLSAGAYVLRFDARAAGPKGRSSVLSPESPLLSIDVFSGEGILLLHHVLNGSDFPPDGSYRSFALPFQSPFYNKWSYPVYAQVTTSGLAETWVSTLSVVFDADRTWGVTGLWVGLIGLAIVAFNWPGRRQEVEP